MSVVIEWILTRGSPRDVKGMTFCFLFAPLSSILVYFEIKKDVFNMEIRFMCNKRVTHLSWEQCNSCRKHVQMDIEAITGGSGCSLLKVNDLNNWWKKIKLQFLCQIIFYRFSGALTFKWKEIWRERRVEVENEKACYVSPEIGSFSALKQLAHKDINFTSAYLTF